jgi:hypothetical protein
MFTVSASMPYAGEVLTQIADRITKHFENRDQSIPPFVTLQRRVAQDFAEWLTTRIGSAPTWKLRCDTIVAECLVGWSTGRLAYLPGQEALAAEAAQAGQDMKAFIAATSTSGVAEEPAVTLPVPAEQPKKIEPRPKPTVRVTIEVDGGEIATAKLDPNAEEDYQEGLDLVGSLTRYMANGVYLRLGSKSQVASVFEKRRVLARLRTLGVIAE